MLRLDLNLVNTEEGRLFVKISMNCDVIGTWSTWTINDDLLSNKMEINLHMFDALMLNRVGRQLEGVDVVTVDKGAPRRRALELMEQLA
jgi:uncharacterized protein YacL (UPF0231 family)